jgi:hypothetical protein
LNKNKPQGDPSYFNFPIGDNEKTYPSVTNVHSERALHAFCGADEVLAHEQKFMSSTNAAVGFKVIFKKHQERCEKENYVNELKEPTEFFDWIARGRKAKCYLCQDDLSSLYIAGPQSKMMDRRNSTAGTGNYAQEGLHTRQHRVHL